jgi:adhesin transport system membrane fusion protein
MVKITAYDFSIYGGLQGTLENISADTTTNDKGETFYTIRVRTFKNYLGTENKPLTIIPGMQATVDILTGHKTVLQYLLKPILKAHEVALTER